MKSYKTIGLSLGTAIFVAVLIGLCGLNGLAYADVQTTVNQDYGPDPGQWGPATIAGTGEGPITYVIKNNRNIPIRFCAYVKPPDNCPPSRVVGGPNPGEITFSDCILAGGTGAIILPEAGCATHKICPFQCSTKEGQVDENSDGTGEDYPGDCPSVPTLSEWGLLILLVLLVLSGIIVIRHRRREVVRA